MENEGEIILKNKKLISKSALNKKFRFNEITCDLCNSKIVPLKGRLLEIAETMKKIYSKKPTPTFVYDQRPVNFETTVRRALYLLWRNDLTGKNILVLGDDDLTSIAIALIGEAKRIMVLDIDARLISFIDKISKEYSLKIETLKCDFTKGAPEGLKGAFDVFLTDPTPNPDCFSLFISLGASFLKKGKERVGYVSFFPSHQDIKIDFQKILTAFDLIITDMIPRFTEYDFVQDTYKQKDKELLEKFDSGESKISFFENITRFITTENTFKKISAAKNQKLPISKATKRIIDHPEKDPAFLKGEKDFVLNEIKKIRNELC